MAKPASKTPDDLAAALKKNKKALAVYEAFSPSAKREYVDWLTEAKRDETRAKRLAQAVEEDQWGQTRLIRNSRRNAFRFFPDRCAYWRQWIYHARVESDFDAISMSETIDNLILDLLEWLAREERSYRETMDAWRTSCPRLTVWEDANERGLVELVTASGGASVQATPAGRAWLAARRPQACARLRS